MKWAGGKSRLLDRLMKRLPAGRFSTYAEPFCGGGAMFFALAAEPERRFERALLADKKRARGSSRSARLSSAVPETEAFLEAAFHQGESVALQTDRLLRLLDDYSAPELRVAVKDALDKKSPRASSVAYILAKRRRVDKAPRALTVDLDSRDAGSQERDLYDPDRHDCRQRPSRMGFCQ